MFAVCFIVLLWLHYITRHRQLNVSQANLRRKSTWRRHKDMELNIEKQKLNLEALPFFNQPNWSHGNQSFSHHQCSMLNCGLKCPVNLFTVPTKTTLTATWSAWICLSMPSPSSIYAGESTVFAWERAISLPDKPWHCHFVCVTKAQLILP